MTPTTPTPQAIHTVWPMPPVDGIRTHIENCGIEISKAMGEINSPSTDRLIDAIISLQTAVNYLDLKVQKLETARTKEQSK